MLPLHYSPPCVAQLPLGVGWSCLNDVNTPPRPRTLARGKTLGDFLRVRKVPAEAEDRRTAAGDAGTDAS